MYSKTAGIDGYANVLPGGMTTTDMFVRLRAKAGYQLTVAHSCTDVTGTSSP